MNTRIFIMAQGRGSRWSRDSRTTIESPCEYKQVLSITSDENLISRTIRQLRYDSLIKVICSEDFAKYLPKGTEIESFREPVQPILHGIWNTKREWAYYDRILIILGDVAFSNIGIKKIFVDNQEMSLFGRFGSNPITGKEAREIFAVSIRRNKYVEAVNNFSTLWKSGKEKLWDYYGMYKSSLVEINDYTDDIDSLEAYVQFWPIMKEKIIEDDSRYNNK